MATLTLAQYAALAPAAQGALSPAQLAHWEYLANLQCAPTPTTGGTGTGGTGTGGTGTGGTGTGTGGMRMVRTKLARLCATRLVPAALAPAPVPYQYRYPMAPTGTPTKHQPY